MYSAAGEVAQQVVAEGGVTVIKDAMAKFPESTELAKEAQEALDNISKNSMILIFGVEVPTSSDSILLLGK